MAKEFLIKARPVFIDKTIEFNVSDLFNCFSNDRAIALVQAAGNDLMKQLDELKDELEQLKKIK